MKRYKDYFGQIQAPPELAAAVRARAAAPRRRQAQSRWLPAGAGLAAALLLCWLLWPPAEQAEAPAPVLAEQDTDKQAAAQPGGEQDPATANQPSADEEPIVSALLPERADKSVPALPHRLVLGQDGAEAGSYASPQPGEIMLFPQVRTALAEREGEKAVYFLALDVFDSQGQLAADDPALAAEIRRLAADGYPLAWSVGEEGGTYLSGLFSSQELAEFPAATDYGYAFRFPYNNDGSPAQPRLALFGLSLVLSQEQLPAAGPLAAYLPASPVDMVWESAYYYCQQSRPEEGLWQEDETDATLTVVWSSGYDYLSWTVRPYQPEDAARLVQAGEREKYDLSLYPIPRADSVPTELRQVVEDPIFTRTELSLELLQARAVQVADAGDTDGWRLRFSVLYGETLVSISAKGLTAAEILALLPPAEAE